MEEATSRNVSQVRVGARSEHREDRRDAQKRHLCHLSQEHHSKTIPVGHTANADTH